MSLRSRQVFASLDLRAQTPHAKEDSCALFLRCKKTAYKEKPPVPADERRRVYIKTKPESDLKKWQKMVIPDKQVEEFDRLAAALETLIRTAWPNDQPGPRARAPRERRDDASARHPPGR